MSKRRYILFFLISICCSLGYVHGQISPEWSEEEIKNANTVKNIAYLNAIEKEAVIVLNLARLYPKKFVRVEVEPFNGTPKYGDYIKGSRYKTSLVRTLNKMKPASALNPDAKMTKNAKCFAVESGKRGYSGHKRKSCAKENYAECCSYGMETGKEIILQLLIDHDVPSLGHRKICLDKNYTLIGIGEAKHKTYDTCCVLELL